MIKYIIIDDEPIAHRIIEGYADNLNHFKKAGNFYDAIDAMEYLSKHQVDLFFLDLHMPKLT
ncbi:MAG: response regulator, partial [Bacteroidota bacterium]